MKKETNFEKCEKKEVKKYNDSRNAAEKMYRDYLKYAHNTHKKETEQAFKTKKELIKNCPCEERVFSWEKQT